MHLVPLERGGRGGIPKIPKARQRLNNARERGEQMFELTLEEVYEAMELSGKNPKDWIQFCAFVSRNLIMIIE